MINFIAGIVNSTHYVGQVAGPKAVKGKINFEKDCKERVNQVRRVGKVKAMSHLTNQKQYEEAQHSFRIELVVDDKGKHSMAMVVSGQSFKQINLEGTRLQGDEKFINPAKVKAAYFHY